MLDRVLDLLDLALEVAHGGVLGDGSLESGDQGGARLSDGVLVGSFQQLFAGFGKQVDTLACLLSFLLLPSFAGLNHLDKHRGNQGQLLGQILLG